MNKKVSVIIPVYNSEKHLSSCVDSILAQTYKDIEIILVNDGSTDDSQRIIDEYTVKYENIKSITKENGGAGSARNKGLDIAEGYFINFCDSDDELMLTLIEHLVEADNNNYDIILSGYLRKTYEGKIIYNRPLVDKPLSPYTNIGPCAKLYRRQFVEDNKIRFAESIPISEDAFFNLCAYSRTDRIKITSYTEYIYWYNEKSLTNTDGKDIQKIDILIEALELTHSMLKDYLSEELKYYYVKTAMFYLLITCKNAEKNKIYNAYDKLFSWVEKNVGYKNRYLSVFDNSGENFSVKSAIVAFRFLQKIHLIKPMIYLYSKV